MTDNLSRTHHLRVAKSKAERCDGCGAVIPAGSFAEYRMDGAVFHDRACADLHADTPLDHSGRK